MAKLFENQHTPLNTISFNPDEIYNNYDSNACKLGLYIYTGAYTIDNDMDKDVSDPAQTVSTLLKSIKNATEEKAQKLRNTTVYGLLCQLR
ncbi:unnamed protein product, partial [Didymodactylos carnosus]